MQSFGIDLGASTIKVVRLQEDKIVYKKIEKHFGKILPTLKGMLEDACPDEEEWMAVGVTGSNARVLTEEEPAVYYLGDIPAVTEGVKFLVPEAGSVRVFRCGAPGTFHPKAVRQVCGICQDGYYPQTAGGCHNTGYTPGTVLRHDSQL